MKKLKLIVAGLISCVGMSCTSQPAFVLEGTVEGFAAEQIYLYTVKNEYYHLLEVVDSARMQQGHFKFERQALRPELYFLGKADEENQTGDYIFLEPGRMTANGKIDAQGKYTWKLEGSNNQDIYADFQAENYVKSGQIQLDSLNNLWYAAKARGDQEEMNRIKKLSIPLYDEAGIITVGLAEKYIRQYREKAIAMYLYRKYPFAQQDYNDTTTIHQTMAYIQGFGPEAKGTAYYDALKEQLGLLDQCAVGRKVCEIIGVDTLGKEMKLSDFRGKYVLVDLWNSYCHWCREESPNMRKALTECGDGFTIFGVSNDMKKELWVEAIRKDQAHWNQVLLDQKAWEKLCHENCVRGIPHIMLIDPEGIIVAKDVRGTDIINVPKKFLGL